MTVVDTKLIVILTAIGVVSILLVPACMFYCKKCALYAINNVGGGSRNDNENREEGGRRRSVINDEEEANYGIAMSTRDRQGIESVEERRERKKREKNVLRRIVIKVSSIDLLLFPSI